MTFLLDAQPLTVLYWPHLDSKPAVLASGAILLIVHRRISRRQMILRLRFSTVYQ